MTSPLRPGVLSRAPRAVLVAAGALVVALIAGVAAAGVPRAGRPALALVVVTAVGVLSVRVSIQTLVIVEVAVAYLVDWLIYDVHALPLQAAWLIELLIALLYLRLLLAYRGRPLPAHAAVFAVLIACVAVAVPVGAASGTPWLVLAVGLRNHLRFVLLGLAVALAPCDDGFGERLWRTLLAIGGVQVLASVAEYLARGGGDGVTGTLGPGMSGVQALFLAPLSAVCIIWGATRSGAAPRLAAMAFGVVLLAPVLLGAAWGGLLAFPAAFAVVLVIRQPHLSRALVVALVAALALVPAVSLGVAAADRFYAESGIVVPGVDSIRGILEYDARSSAVNPGRITRIAETLRLWEGASIAQRAVGWGPGSASESTLGSSFAGPLLSLPGVWLLGLSFSRVLLETGLLGLVAAVAILAYGVRVARRATLAGLGSGSVAVAGLLAALGVVLLFGFLYAGVWTEPGTAVAFWVAYGFTLGRLGAVARPS